MHISMTRSEVTWGNRYLLFQMFFLPTLVSLALIFFWPEATSLHLNMVCWAVNFCVVCGIFHRFLWESTKDALSNAGRTLRTASGGLLLYWVANLGISLMLVLLFPSFFNVNNANIQSVAQENLLLTSIGTVVLVPIVEEIFYRGLVFGLLLKHNALLAYAVSTVVFCSIHVSGYVGYYEPLHLLLCALQYVPAGLVLANCYHRTGNIFTSTLIHMAVNAIAMLSMR